MDKMHKAASLFEGTKNFLSFTGKPTKIALGISTMRSIYSIKIKPGKPFMAEYDHHADMYHYWDVVVHGRAFLYRQVNQLI